MKTKEEKVCTRTMQIKLRKLNMPYTVTDSLLPYLLSCPADCSSDNRCYAVEYRKYSTYDTQRKHYVNHRVLDSR